MKNKPVAKLRKRSNKPRATSLRPRKPRIAVIACHVRVWWSKALPETRANILRYLNATQEQIAELRNRQWLALSKWVRVGLKRLSEQEQRELGILKEA